MNRTKETLPTLLRTEDVWNSEKFHLDKCSIASRMHGVGDKNGAFKDGWDECWKWVLQNVNRESPHTVPDVTEVVVDGQGVTFGKNCWVAHEAITGERTGLVKTQYEKWFASLKVPKDGHVRLTLTTRSKDDE